MLNIFGGSAKVIEHLEGKVTDLEKKLESAYITASDLRQEKLDEVNRVYKDKQYALSGKEIEIDNLQIQITSLEAERDNDRSEFERGIEIANEKAISQKEASLDKEYKAKFEAQEKENKTLNKTAQEFQGKYEGTLLVVIELEKQVKTLSGLVEKFIGQLPKMDVKVSSPESISTVVNTSSK